MGDSPSNPPSQLHLRMTEFVKLPRLSGKASAAWLAACFALTGVLIPAVLRLPRWIDFEIVLGIWWVIWLGVLARLLYTGQRVAHDYEMKEPTNWFSSKPSDAQKALSSNSSWWDGFFWGSVFDGESLMVGLLIVAGLILLVGVIWFFIEIAIPVVLFLLYVVVRGMLAAVVNDRHRCRGKPLQALFGAFLWATCYTAPLAVAVWFVHYVLQHQGVH